MKFAPRVPPVPPRRPLRQIVEIVVLDELGSGGNRVFHHHVFPLRAGNGKPDRQRVAGLNRPIQWIELVADAVLLPNRTQFEILARQREIERTHIREFLLVGIVLATQ